MSALASVHTPFLILPIWRSPAIFATLFFLSFGVSIAPVSTSKLEHRYAIAGSPSTKPSPAPTIAAHFDASKLEFDCACVKLRQRYESTVCRNRGLPPTYRSPSLTPVEQRVIE